MPGRRSIWLEFRSRLKFMASLIRATFGSSTLIIIMAGDHAQRSGACSLGYSYKPLDSTFDPLLHYQDR
jgi:hypothetical protein